MVPLRSSVPVLLQGIKKRRSPVGDGPVASAQALARGGPAITTNPLVAGRPCEGAPSCLGWTVACPSLPHGRDCTGCVKFFWGFFSPGFRLSFPLPGKATTLVQHSAKTEQPTGHSATGTLHLVPQEDSASRLVSKSVRPPRKTPRFIPDISPR